MLNLPSRDIVISILLIFFGLFGGVVLYQKYLLEPCPACVLPECPPQTVLQINNEKIKVKGGSNLDLKSIIKDNVILNKLDSLNKQDTLIQERKKKGFRLFGKKIF
jgi:hypothetical protein